MKTIASDNHASVHPEIIKAITEANHEHSIAYGADSWTERAISRFKEHFGGNIDLYFMLTGTGANVVGFKSVTDSFHSVICMDSAHTNVHECGAPEKYTGCKLITFDSEHGKMMVRKWHQISPM